MSTRTRKLYDLLSGRPWLVFLFFSVLVVLARWPTFYQSVIDWNESLYLLMAKAWLNGSPPYTVIWDNKPPGIYAIFLLAYSLLGHSVLSIRIAACVFVAITCFLLYKMGTLIERNGIEIGLLAGILYATATLSIGGMPSNTELFFTTFVVMAFYLLFADLFRLGQLSSAHYLRLFSIGLLLGIGFEIKYVVVFDFLALALVLVAAIVLKARPARAYWPAVRAVSVLSLGFVLPFAGVSLCFLLAGHFHDYVYANFTANKLRTVDLKFSFVTPLRAIYEQTLGKEILWLSVPSVAFYLFVAKAIPSRERWIQSGLLVWFFLSLIGLCIVFRGSFYPHYFLQCLPSLCLITAYMVISLVSSLDRAEYRQYASLLSVFLILIITISISSVDVIRTFQTTAECMYFRHVKGVKDWGDTAALIADYLKPRIHPNDYIYMVDDNPIVYLLADARIPSKYAYPPFLLIQTDLPNISGIDPLEELARILQKDPVYIVKQRSYVNFDQYYVPSDKIFLSRLDRTLDKEYKIEASIDKFDVYRLSEKPGEDVDDRIGKAPLSRGSGLHASASAAGHAWEGEQRKTASRAIASLAGPLQGCAFACFDGRNGTAPWR